jgi:hypothetical protein
MGGSLKTRDESGIGADFDRHLITHYSKTVAPTGKPETAEPKVCA